MGSRARWGVEEREVLCVESKYMIRSKCSGMVILLRLVYLNAGKLHLLTVVMYSIKALYDDGQVSEAASHTCITSLIHLTCMLECVCLYR